MNWLLEGYRLLQTEGFLPPQSVLDETEQKQLEARKAELVEFINSAKEQRLNTDSFLSMVRKYTDIAELSAEIIRSFVERIEVLQPEKVPGTRIKNRQSLSTGTSLGQSKSPMSTRKRHNQRNASYAVILLRIKIP